MRIELPLSAWAEAQHAQDDAHTLTVPVHPQAVPHPLLGAWSCSEPATVRVEVAAQPPLHLTITF